MKMERPHPPCGHLLPEGRRPKPSGSLSRRPSPFREKVAEGRMRVLFFLVLSFFARRAEASMSQLKEANRLFKNGHYEDALKLYNDALVDQPHSSGLHFDAGDAAYQMGDFDKARKEFEEASQSANPLLKSAAHYNRGNALFRQNDWAGAIEAYKESLRVNPRDEDAKYNLGVAMRTQQNPPKPPPKSGQPEDQQKKGGGSSQPSSPQAGQMSKEDAERLLEAARSGELKKSNQKFPKTDTPHPDEDW